MILEVFCDMAPTPAEIRVGFKWQPQTPEAGTLVLGRGGLRDTLQQQVGELKYLKDRDAWSFDWTDKSRAGITQWFQRLASAGLPMSQLTGVLGALEKVPVATTTPGLSRLTAAFGAVPSGALIRIDSLEKCPEELWDALCQVPGVFWVLPSGRPMPIRGTWARQYFRAHSVHPSPVYVSAVHVEQVARLFPQVAATKDRIRAEIGLDYALYGPQYFPIPRVDPETGRYYSLLPFQCEAVSKALAMKRVLITLPVGSGKSVLALAMAQFLLTHGQIDRVVVIGPRSLLKEVWSAEAAKFYGLTPIIAHGDARKRRGRIMGSVMNPHASKYILTTYDAWRMPDAQQYLVPLLGPRTLVIIDEAHHLKHAESKRYIALRDALDGVRVVPGGSKQFRAEWVTNWRLFMTGTPDHDKLVDLYGPVQLLGFHCWSTEDEFQGLYFHRETVRTNRRDAHGDTVLKQRVVKVNPAALPALQEVVASVGFFRTLEQIGIQLPPLTRRDWTIEPTGYERAAYDIIKGHVQTYMDATLAAHGQAQQGMTGAVQKLQVAQQNLLAAISMERQFSCDPAVLVMSQSPAAAQIRQRVGDRNLLAMSPGSKMQVLLDVLGDHLRAPAKTVVFTSFERVLEVLKALMRAPPRGLDEDQVAVLRYLPTCALFYDGSMSDVQRTSTVQAFKNDPKYRVLFATDAAGEGLNLQDKASYVIHYDFPLSMGLIEQREGRVYRRGQKLPCFITSLHFSPQDDMQKALETFALKLGNSSFIDANLRRLIDVKKGERDAFRAGL